MKQFLLVWLAILTLSLPAFAGYPDGDLSTAGNTNTSPSVSAYGMVVRAFLNQLLSCEDPVIGRCVIEERYLTIPVGGTDAMIAADQLIKTGPGYVRSITCYSDATATAGTIALRDSTTAGAGNILWSFDVLAVAYNTPFTINLQTAFSTGLYLDFTTTADVKCMVTFR